MGLPAPALDAARATLLRRAYQDHATAIRRALSRLGVPERDLDDAVHEVFIVLLRRFSDFDRTRGLRAWLYGIARRVASHHRRAAARKQAFTGRLHHEGPGRGRPAPDPDEHVARGEAAALLSEFLDELGPEKSTVFVLSHIEGLRGPEIARALDTNLNTVYWRLRAARSDFEHVVATRDCDLDRVDDAEPQYAFAPIPFLRGWSGWRLWGERLLHGALLGSAAFVPIWGWPQTPHAEALPGHEETSSFPVRSRRVRLPEAPGTAHMDFDEELVEGERPIRTGRGPSGPDRDPAAHRYTRTRLRPPPLDTAISRTGVAVTIRSHISEVRRCYNRALARDAALEGRMSLFFRIEADAHAHDVRVETEGLQDADLQGCVADAVTQWRFPVVVDGEARPVEVHYPIQLRVERPPRSTDPAAD